MSVFRDKCPLPLHGSSLGRSNDFILIMVNHTIVRILMRIITKGIVFRICNLDTESG